MLMRRTRRQFLKDATLLLGAGSVVEGPAILSEPTPNSKLATAVIGCGGRGEASLQAAMGEKLVAIVDVDDSRLAAAQHTATGAGSQPKAFYDYRQMFDRMHKEIDAVFVATPDHHHAPASLLALGLNKHVFCEKPLCHDI